MSGVVFVPRHDTAGKRDATKAFHPEAQRLVLRRGGHVAYIDNHASRPSMRAMVQTIMRAKMGIGCEGCDEHVHDMRLSYVAFACHGYASGIQLGFDIATVEQLANVMAEVCEDDVVVPLYACSTASTLKQLLRMGRGPGGDGGFADELRDALCRRGLTRCTVDAHTTAGHATMNPNVRRFAGDGSHVGGIGGVELFPRGKAKSTQRAQHNRWAQRLAEKEDQLRFDFPWLTAGELHDAVARTT